jgi:hypothetical protein
MSKLGGFFNIFIALLAIAAAVVSFFLFERRQEFRGRADKLAAALTESVASLDQDSASGTSEKVTFTPGTLDTPETGTLGWKAYRDAKDAQSFLDVFKMTPPPYAAFDEPLKAAKELAAGVNTQRNFLADRMVEAGGTLGLDSKYLTSDALKSLKEPEAYQKESEKLVQLAKDVKARDDSIIGALVASSKMIKHPLKASDFQNRSRKKDADGTEVYGAFQHQKSLKSFQSNVKNLKTQSDRYAKTLMAATEKINQYKWKANRKNIADEKKYAGELGKLEADFKEVNNKLLELVKTQKELKKLQISLEDAQDELKLTKAELNKSRQTLLAERAAKQGANATQTGGPAVDIPAEPTKVETIDPDLKGRILEVNKQWKFVIVDLGFDKIKEEVDILIARGEHFVARAKVTKVFRQISIAEIVSETQALPVEAGDRVLLPKDFEER